MEFNLLRKISVYTTGISFFVAVISNFIFESISFYFKYIKRNYEIFKNNKIIKNLEEVSIKSQIVTAIFIVLFIVFWWESLSY